MFRTNPLSIFQHGKSIKIDFKYFSLNFCALSIILLKDNTTLCYQMIFSLVATALNYDNSTILHPHSTNHYFPVLLTSMNQRWIGLHPD